VGLHVSTIDRYNRARWSESRASQSRKTADPTRGRTPGHSETWVQGRESLLFDRKSFISIRVATNIREKG